MPRTIGASDSSIPCTDANGGSFFVTPSKKELREIEKFPTGKSRKKLISLFGKRISIKLRLVSLDRQIRDIKGKKRSSKKVVVDAEIKQESETPAV